MRKQTESHKGAKNRGEMNSAPAGRRSAPQPTFVTVLKQVEVPPDLPEAVRRDLVRVTRAELVEEAWYDGYLAAWLEVVRHGPLRFSHKRLVAHADAVADEDDQLAFHRAIGRCRRFYRPGAEEDEEEWARVALRPKSREYQRFMERERQEVDEIVVTADRTYRQDDSVVEHPAILLVQMLRKYPME